MTSTLIHIHSNELIQIIVIHIHIHEFMMYNYTSNRDSLPFYTMSNANQLLLISIKNLNVKVFGLFQNKG